MFFFASRHQHLKIIFLSIQTANCYPVTLFLSPLFIEASFTSPLSLLLLSHSGVLSDGTDNGRPIIISHALSPGLGEVFDGCVD